METLKKPVWRVPLVLGTLGLICRSLAYVLGMIWGRIQIARGPGPEGAYTLTSGHVREILSVISFLLFWWAGRRFVRGLTRREIFASATIMAVVYAALLAAEQISQHVFGTYSMAVYRLYALAEAKGWVDQLLFRLFDTVSVPLAVPGLFAPYLYLLFGKKAAPAAAGNPEDAENAP